MRKHASQVAYWSKHDWIRASAVTILILHCTCAKVTLLGCFHPVMECGKDTAAVSFLLGSSGWRLWLEDPHSVSSDHFQTLLQSKTFFSFPLYHRVSSSLEADIVPCPLAPSSFSLTDISPNDLLHVYSSWHLLLGEPVWITSICMNHRSILFLWEYDLNWKNKFRVEILVVIWGIYISERLSTIGIIQYVTSTTWIW